MKEDNRPEFVKETERIYRSFETEINMLRQCPPSKKTDIVLREIVVSAYVKAYDFVCYICKLNDFKDAFFQLPMLRGICEDLIVISYLIDQSQEKQNYLLVTKRFEELNRSTKAQVSFFTKYNKGQIVLPILNDGDIQPVLESHINAGYFFEEASFPSVFKMSEYTSLKDLYSFIYHATSKVVHFDVLTLLSMGWGKIDKEERTIEANYSYQHDYKHYYSFGLFYSAPRPVTHRPESVHHEKQYPPSSYLFKD